MDQAAECETEKLIEQAAAGDDRAGELLLQHHRARLQRMVAVRMDRRIAPRVDPSDVVQETLVVAHTRLPSYLEDRPVAFYPWLRQLAWERLIEIHRRHLHAEQRSVHRERPREFALSNESVAVLASSLSTPSQHLMQEELNARLRDALDRLPADQREILVLRHLEGLSVVEAAAVLEIPEGTVKSRHFRAAEALRRLFDDG